MTTALLVALFLVALGAVVVGRQRARRVHAAADVHPHSRPNQHGTFLAIATVLPAFLLVVVWSIAQPRIENAIVLDRFAGELADANLPQREAFLRDARAIAGSAITSAVDETREAAAALYARLDTVGTWLLVLASVALVVAGFLWGYRQIAPRFRARTFNERTIRIALMLCSAVAIATTLGIVLSLIFESLRFFSMVPLDAFLFGLNWSPQSAFVGAGAEATGTNPLAFGAVPLFAGTLLITFVAMLVAAPIGLMAAIYLSDYASPRVRSIAKPLMEILAGIPTVVYGFFAALTVAPFFRNAGESIGLSVSSESALAAGLVMGIMIIPFVSSLSDDVINSVPQSLRDGSAAMGATKSETIRKVVLPAALPGIVSALLLAVSRAIGETMIVVMAAGLAANLTINPLEAVTTVTVQIVTLLVGDQEFDSAKTLAAFALGLVLFVITLTLNVIALQVVRRYREQYD